MDTPTALETPADTPPSRVTDTRSTPLTRRARQIGADGVPASLAGVLDSAATGIPAAQFTSAI